MLCTTLRTELGIRFYFRTTVGTEFFGSQGLAAFGAELPAAGLCSAVRAGSDDRLLEFVGGNKIDGFRLLAGIIDGSLYLNA